MTEEREVREFTWGIKPLDIPDPERALDNARQRIVEKFLIGKDVRLTVPMCVPVTLQMVKLFCALGGKAQRQKRKFYLRVDSCVAQVVKQTKHSGKETITIETI